MTSVKAKVKERRDDVWRCEMEDGLVFEVPVSVVNAMDDGPALTFLHEGITYEIGKEEEAVAVSSSETVTPSVTETKKGKFAWTALSTQLLIAEYKKLEAMLGTATVKSKVQLYKMLSARLHTNGYLVTPQQAQDKMKSLTKKYKDVRRKNKEAT